MHDNQSFLRNPNVIYITGLLLVSVTLIYSAGRQPVRERTVQNGSHQRIQPVQKQIPSLYQKTTSFYMQKTPISSKDIIRKIEPVFVSELTNLNDFCLFANGSGWDGNWYVGYNTCWVQKFSGIDQGDYSRAFIGAKLGRMKTEPIPERPSWEKRPIAGEISIAIAEEAVWPASQSFFLTDTRDISLEGDPENAVEGVGEAHWFWVEIAVSLINFRGDNYIALYSPSPVLSGVKNSPILAAGWGDKETDTWLNSSVKGTPPPVVSESLRTGVTYFDPAIAIKLVPPNEYTVDVEIVDLEEDQLYDKMVVKVSAVGYNIDRVWLEYSMDENIWERVWGNIWNQPYTFTLKSTQVPEGDIYIRAAAADILENVGYSPSYSIKVKHPKQKPKKK